MRAPSAALTALVDALALLRGIARPVVPRAIPLTEALGRSAATDVDATRCIPASPTALRDGFAVEAARVGGASPYAPVPLPRIPVWVEAGDRLPADADAVLPAEWLEGRNAVAEVGAGEGVRAAGEDFAEGASLVRAGERIKPRHLLALATAGVREVEAREPRVRLVVTGAPEPDALSPVLVALIARAGGIAETQRVADEPDAIACAVAAGATDAVFVLGGTGFGRGDRSAEGLAAAGRILAHGLALHPGETGGIGEADGRPVLLLPGRPDAALATFLALGRPLLAMLAGASDVPPRRAPLLRKITSLVGLSEILFVRWRIDGIEPLGGAELPLQRLIEADGAVLVPPEREGYPAGSKVEVVPL